MGFRMPSGCLLGQSREAPRLLRHPEGFGGASASGPGQPADRLSQPSGPNAGWGWEEPRSGSPLPRVSALALHFWETPGVPGWGGESGGRKGI